MVNALKSKGTTLRVQRDMQKSTLFVIADASGAGMSKMRTIKVMRAMISGLPVVTPEWVLKCTAKQKLVPLTASDICTSLPTKEADAALGPGITKEYGLVRGAALIERHGDRAAHPFAGVGVYLVGPYRKGGGVPEKKELVQMLKEVRASGRRRGKRRGFDDDI
jgi:hypothetical protein